MLIGRNSELNQLGTYYDRENSQILVLYGEPYIGKTKLLQEFMQDKPGFYYLACPASEREQKYRLGMRLANLGIKTLKYPTYSECLSALSAKHSQKKVLVIDEFQNIIKTSPEFINELVSFIHNSRNSQDYLVILSSSSVAYVENILVSKIGEAAYELSGFLKMKELSFKDLREYFPLYTNEECAYVWALLGGFPGLWKMFDSKLSLKQNIISKIIARDGVLHDVAIKLVESELRETGVYNTILSALSDGKNKLNDLYEHTGFSRAKISVYLKNLMELELVKKVFSVDTKGRDYVQKGIYDIKNHFVDFYFSFMYKYASDLELMSAEEFYANHIQGSLKSFVGKYYVDICREYLMQQNSKGRLPINAVDFGKWVGKPGTIDIVATDEADNAVLALCVFDKPMITYDDFEWLQFCARKAELPTDSIYLFSAGRFDEKLTLEGKISQRLHLVLLDRM